MVNNLDINWNNLRVWQDLNQDGESQTNELSTLNEIGISGFNVAKSENSQVLANGNQIADLGTFIRSDGSLGTMGEVGDLADVDLTADTFHREFPDTLPMPAEAEGLPDMQGSGVLRDLLEATSQSTTLINILTEYSQAATRSEQLALLDQLLSAWADTGGLIETVQERFGDPAFFRVKWDTIGSASRYDYNYQTQPQEWLALVDQWQEKIHILESFNGRYFFTLPNTSGWTGGETRINLFEGQVSSLNQSYQALRDSVYDALLFQTRFKPVVDAITLSINADGIAFDFSAAETHFQDLITGNTAQGISDLIEFNSKSQNLVNLGWQGWDQLGAAISTQPLTAELQEVYLEFNVLAAGTAGYTNSGTNKSEIIVAGDSGEATFGNDGGDIILGGGGNDTLAGGTGNDILDGGADNDTLYGNTGDDFYLVGRGSGQDTINNYDTTAGKTDSVVFKAGINLADLLVTQTETGLSIYLKDPNDPGKPLSELDSLTIQDASSEGYGIERFLFASGTTLTMDQLINLMATSGDDNVNLLWNLEGASFYAGEGNDTITTGLHSNLTISGGEGNDTISSGYGPDVISGDAGDDWISSGSGDDVLSGGDGNDAIIAGVGNDTITGGSGNDHLEGGAGDDTYVFNSGDSIDTIFDTDNLVNSTLGGNDILAFGDSITATDLLVSQTATDLILAIKDPNDQTATMEQLTNRITIADFATPDCRVENIRFSDGLLRNLVANFSDTTNTIYGGSGDDFIFPGINGDKTVFADAGDDVIIMGAGNDTAYGGDGVDIIDGGTGADVMLGGSNSDIYMVDNSFDIVTELFNEGSSDRVVSSISYSLSDNVEDLTLIGMAAINATGNELDNLLIGNSGVNILTGGAGNDSLDGGTSVDMMSGGTGDDSYVVEVEGETVTELAEEGLDTVYSSINFTLSANVENLSLTETAINATGNTLANLLIGNSADNTLIGGTGNDVLEGGLGADSLEGGSDDDSYIFTIGDGADTIYDGQYAKGDTNNTNSGVGGNDTIHFSGEITAADLMIGKNSTDLIIALRDPSNPSATLDQLTDKITVQDFLNYGNRIEGLAFADGTTLNIINIFNSRLRGQIFILDILPARPPDYRLQPDNQFSTLSSGMREKCLRLPLTRVRSLAMTMAAISRSARANGVPAPSSRARRRPQMYAALLSKVRTLTADKRIFWRLAK
ncbi:MAG: calcium-binding protein [Desulfobulbaceae bacterium]|nr:calcium-binding protein [Desulfobulbaceae bacterium]